MQHQGSPARACTRTKWEAAIARKISPRRFLGTCGGVRMQAARGENSQPFWRRWQNQRLGLGCCRLQRETPYHFGGDDMAGRAKSYLQSSSLLHPLLPVLTFLFLPASNQRPLTKIIATHTKKLQNSAEWFHLYIHPQTGRRYQLITTNISK